MFDLDLPCWEYIARALLIYCALLLMMRFSGKRTLGQFTPFDLLVVMLLSESVSPGLTGGDNSTTAGLIVALTLILLNLLIATITARSRKASELVEGRPVLLGRDGKVFDDALRRNNVPRSDVEQALREEDCELEEMRCLFLEADGKITVQQR